MMDAIFGNPRKYKVSLNISLDSSGMKRVVPLNKRRQPVHLGEMVPKFLPCNRRMFTADRDNGIIWYIRKQSDFESSSKMLMQGGSP
jgi:hypothetical protein